MPKGLLKFTAGEFCLDPKKDRIGQILDNNPEKLSIKWLPEEEEQIIILGHLNSKSLLRLSRLKKLDLRQYVITLCGLPTAISKIETYGNEEFSGTRIYLKSLCFERFDGKFSENDILLSLPAPIFNPKFDGLEIQSKQRSSIIKTILNFYY